MDETYTLKLDDQLCFALYAATNAVTRSYGPRLDSVGLTYPQYLVMLVLWQDGPSTISHFAKRLKMLPESVSPILDKLRGVGFIAQGQGGLDAQVSLTEEGAALEHAAALQQHQVVCDTGLEETAFEALREELQSLVKRMETAQP